MDIEDAISRIEAHPDTPDALIQRHRVSVWTVNEIGDPLEVTPPIPPPIPPPDDE